MGKFLKYAGFGLGGILVIALVLTVFNWSKIQRLKRVTTLFEAENIVHNFSHMDEVLFSRPLAAPGPAHVWPETPKALPNAVMINGKASDLPAFLDDTQTTSLLVIKDGEILHEDYRLGTGPDDLRISWSVAKSFLSAMMGQAVDSGEIKSLDDDVAAYVPSLKGTAYEGASIRNVLNMASGVKFNEDYLDKDSDINKMGRVLALGKSMDDFAATLMTREFEPGSARQYVSIDTHALGMVLRAATGREIVDIFNDTYGPLGFGKAPVYSTDKQGNPFVLGGLNLRTRDYALFGQMILQGGEWKGEQMIPADWLAASTKASAPEPDLDTSGVDYGYQWWVPKGAAANGGDFFAVGIYEQYIYINPGANMVIVKTSANRKFKEVSLSGRSYKEDSIDVFRSLATYYSEEN